jgi:hypothetical protein
MTVHVAGRVCKRKDSSESGVARARESARGAGPGLAHPWGNISGVYAAVDTARDLADEHLLAGRQRQDSARCVPVRGSSSEIRS